MAIDFHFERVGENEDIVCVPLSGELNSDNCDYLMQCVEGRISAGFTKLILDCENLSYITSMGLGMLVRVNSRMKKVGGDVKLARLHGTGATILKLVGLDRVFQLYPTVEAAVAAHD